MPNAVKISQAEKALLRFLKPDQVSQSGADRFLYARDMLMENTLKLKKGSSLKEPDLICWPESTAEVSRIIETASHFKIPVIPFGGGSGVVGGTVPLFGGIILDLKRMNRIEKIEEKNGSFWMTAETGILGVPLEDQLNAQGYTLGHFPSSILCATLGGYLAARSAGQFSSRYGKIEDMTDAIEVVLPSGRILGFDQTLREFPRARPTDLFIGTEGCLGVITRARLKIHRAAPSRRFRGVGFNRLSDAFKAIREILQSGLRPSVVRLYDPFDTLLQQHGYEKSPGALDPLFSFVTRKANLHRLPFLFPQALQNLAKVIASDVLLILGFEGDAALIEAQENEALAICKRSICRDLGEKPGLHWLKHRYSVSFKMPALLEKGCFLDTIEVATTWDRLMSLYQSIRKKLTKHVFLLAHFSHAYPEGCSIYFTFVGRTGSTEKDLELYRRVWSETMETCLAEKATISHHHGVGLLKGKYLRRELGGAMDFYQEMKRKLDPLNILNPGKMGL